MIRDGLLEHPLRRLALEERLDHGQQQVGLADEGGLRGRRQHGEEAASGWPMSPVAPPPSSRNRATECSSVATSASPAMISTGVFSALLGRFLDRAKYE